MAIGFAAGAVCYLAAAMVKSKFGYHDSLDAFGAHGAGGALSAILTGVLATKSINGGLKDAAGKPRVPGLVDGDGPRAGPDEESQGLYLNLRGEEGYNFEL